MSSSVLSISHPVTWLLVIGIVGIAGVLVYRHTVIRERRWLGFLRQSTKWSGLVMKSKLIVLLAALFVSAPAFAGWHLITQVTKVTIIGGRFYVRGTNPTGHSCVDEANYYGTLAHNDSDPGH